MMSDELESSEKTSVDVREKEVLEEFYQHLIRHSQTETFTLFNAGSRAEIRGQALLLERYKLNADKLMDRDQMTYDYDIRAFHCRQSVPEQFNSTVVHINSACQWFAGYTKLCYENSDWRTDLEYSDINNYLRGVRNGPADNYRLRDFYCSLMKNNFQITGDSIKAILCILGSQNADNVVAVHCPSWPMQVSEWITRPRMNDSPLKCTIRDVVRYGCDFVQVSHKFTTDINEWRYSFSKAELIIISSWKTSQRIVYRTLHMLSKIIKSRIDSTVLCTYYFKTLMLWATEEKPAEFWSEDILINSVCELICELIQWLKIKFCPNYFIPSNNMLNHLTDTDPSKDIDALCQLLQNTYLVIDVLNNSRNVEIDIASRTYQIEAPMWLYTSLVIFEQIDNSDERVTQRFAQSFSALLYQALNFELFNIYHGLLFFRKATNNLIYSFDKNYLLIYIIEHFQSCKRPISYWKQCVYLQHCSSTVGANLLNIFFLEYEPDSHETSTDHMMGTSLNAISAGDIETHHKFLLYCRIVDELDMIVRTDHFNENVSSKSEISIALYETTTVDNKSRTGVKFYKENPGMSPTVSISWFINKAYLANLYYTIQNDFSDTEEICDNIINTYKLSFHNQHFADNGLPVFLSTEWTSVYDKELQAVVGLYSLCSVVLNETDRSRSVCLGVCPVLFAWYLKCRCAADQMDIERFSKCAKDSKLHLNECYTGRNVCGRTWIWFALRVAFSQFLT